VHAVWYDNRYGAGNVLWARSPAAAMGSPLAFGPNQFVNSVSFPFYTGRQATNWLGDYLDVVVAGDEIYAAWADPRGTNLSRIFFAKARLP
jgi:hypothetical protein